MTLEIVIGTAKQIAYAADVASRAGVQAAAARWIADFRAQIMASNAPQEAKENACAALTKLPTTAAFWLDAGYDYDAARVAVCVIAGQDPASLGAVMGARSIYDALVA
jgi:hypothetical protein